MASGIGLRVNSTDCVLYVLAAFAGVGIVIMNGFPAAMDAAGNGGTLVSTLERIVTRMDAVNGQLSAWGAVDMRKDADF